MNVPEPRFDHDHVCALLRDEHSRGRQPALLVLGNDVGTTYRAALKLPHPEPMRLDYFYGLQVVQDPERTGIALVGDKGAWQG